MRSAGTPNVPDAGAYRRSTNRQSESSIVTWKRRACGQVMQRTGAAVLTLIHVPEPVVPGRQ